MSDLLDLGQFEKNLDSAKERRNFRRWVLGIYNKDDKRPETTWWHLVARFRDEQAK